MSSAELPLPQGPRHRERLRAAARPRRHGPRRARAPSGCGRCATGGPGIGGDGVLRVIRTAAIDAGRGPGGRVVHGLPQRRRVALGDVRQRDPASSGATSRSRAWSTRPARCRSAPATASRRSPSPAAPPTARSPSTWVRRRCSRRPRCRSSCPASSAAGRRARRHGQPARGRLRRRPRRRRPAARPARARRGRLPGRRQRGVRRTAWAGPCRDAGPRARLRRDPLLRHRRLRGDGGRRRSPTVPRATPTTGSTCPAAPSRSAGPPTTGS